MTTSYIPIPVDVEPVDIAQDAFDYLGDQVPGWLPSPGNLEAWLIEALAQTAGELRTLAAVVPDTIFEYFGSTILALPPYAAVQATALTSWVMVDAAGYTIPAGTVIAVTPSASDVSYAFQVVDDVVVPNGTTVVSAVESLAVIAGSAASGITGDVAVIDQLVFVESVTLDQPTFGGVDEELDQDYLNRLSALLTLLTPRPILPQDFAILAQDEIEGVGRACAIDLYNPGPPVNANCPRCCTVAVCQADGTACSSDVKAAALSLLQSAREVNFLVFVVDPTYTAIDVTFDVTPYPGFALADVQANVIAQLQNWLDPSQWGIPMFGDPGGVSSWLNTTKVRYLEVAEQVNRADGVGYINSLAFGVHGSTLGQADVTLPGVAPLTEAGTISHP